MEFHLPFHHPFAPYPAALCPLQLISATSWKNKLITVEEPAAHCSGGGAAVSEVLRPPGFHSSDEQRAQCVLPAPARRGRAEGGSFGSQKGKGLHAQHAIISLRWAGFPPQPLRLPCTRGSAEQDLPAKPEPGHRAHLKARTEGLTDGLAMLSLVLCEQFKPEQGSRSCLKG